MKKETISLNQVVEYFSKTINLRYAIKEIQISETESKNELRLQQMWQGSNGTEKWEFIEEVNF